MIDLKWLRDHPEALDRSLARRGGAALAATIVDLDESVRQLQTDIQEKQARRNALSKDIGKIKASGGDADAAMAEVGRLKEAIQAGEDDLRSRMAALEDVLAGLPNILDDDVPDGPDESANVEVRRIGSQRNFSFPPKEHDDLGAALGMDFARAAKMSGARFVTMFGELARLERAIASLMLDIQTKENGYQEVSVPLMVRDDAVYGTGQLPKFADDLFKTTTGHWLIPTAEVALTNLVAGEILDAEELPLRFTAYTPCFRSEAGAAGKDTKGMIRQHQFTKVELVSIAHPSQSGEEHERMTASAEKVLQRLDLPYRVMVLASGDTGFGARKTYDLEVWLPGQGRYREISSCSNCGDFQARRMKARFREKGEKGTSFVHTLNGSGLAVGRTLVAVLENYQEEEGSIVVPTALRPYLDGLERLSPHG
ncbi:MAG: serine--tRNA ligase [Alphaproteobacteria bacterium]|nr:serine--tRNA ligase [Alphaproteobacteria bacterium]